MQPVRTIRRRRLLTDPERLPPAIHPVLRRVYAGRGVQDVEQLSFGLDRLQPADALTNIGAAARLLADAVTTGRRILIVGDFDADGATSTALAVLALRAMGAAHVDFLVPNRFEYGYGLTPEIVAVALERRPGIIVTVDNGISSMEGVAAAKRAGVDVLVTDHHLPGPQLPAADVIVNPNLPGDGFPSKQLAGVGVIFYVLAGLRAELRTRRWFGEKGISAPRLADYLDLVALGTVADVVPLDYNNRVLVANGLRRIRQGQCRPGLLALLQIAGRSHGRAVASDLGFAVAPRLNAAGRLDDMTLGIACLLEDNPAAAKRLATELDSLNRERREIEAEMKADALGMLDRWDGNDGAALPYGLCLFDEHWHAGVIGIVAARVRERVHRPVIVFAPDQGGLLKGSARSIGGVHIRDTLEAVATRYPGLVEKFGGHAMAAGLSLRRADLDTFREAFDAQLRRCLEPADLEGALLSDGELGPPDMTLDLADAIREGGPWGQGFPEPLFDGAFRVAGHRIVGEHHIKLRVAPPGGAPVDAIAFHQAAAWGGGLPGLVRLAYRLEVNEFRGTRQPQLVVDLVAAQSE